MDRQSQSMTKRTTNNQSLNQRPANGRALNEPTKNEPGSADKRKVALVTGASSGIGQATARMLAERGWVVFAASRTIEENIDELHPKSGERLLIHPLTLDILDETSCVQAVSQVASHGQIDALVHCAGAGIAGSVEEIPLDQAIWQFDNLLFGTIRMVRAVLPKMRQQGGGRIILVSSVAATIPIPFQVYYSAAKAAVHALALGLADEIRPLKIKITEIAPGDTRSGFTDARRTAVHHPESPYRERLARSVARMAHDERNGMKPEVIAATIIHELERKHPHILVTPGVGYKLLTALSRLLPLRLVRALVRLLYA
jgi:NAD(P)-dependent dehydrogenase (short-subunit alcohol dehydrogenase family)